MIKVMSGSFLHKLLLVLFVWSALLASGQAVAAWAKISTHLPVYTSSEWYDLSEAPFPLTSATLEVCSKLNNLPNCSFRWGGSRRCRGSCNNGNHGYDLGLRYEFAYEDPNQPPPPEKKYTIELTPVTALAYGNYLTAIEPDGITRSGEPQNIINQVNLVAEVKDQDGNRVNAAIKLKVTALDGSGGHDKDSHTERNPSQAGKLKIGTVSSDTINISEK